MEIKETVLGGEVVNGDVTVQVRRGQIIKTFVFFLEKNFSLINNLETKCIW